MARNEEISKGKIYSEFFTNFAVAWGTAGIITPIFTRNLLNTSLGLFFAGVAGTIISIGFAILLSRSK